MTLEHLNILVGGGSLILACLSIAISVYFYTQAKNTEKNVEVALEGIRSQTEALQSLNRNYVTKLTKHVTEQRQKPLDEALPELLTVMGNFSLLPNATVADQNNGELSEDAKAERVGLLINLVYFMAISNFYAQPELADLELYDDENIYHTATKNIVDGTSTAISRLLPIVDAFDDKLVEKSDSLDAYLELQQIWLKHVRNSAQVYKQRLES